MTAKDTKTTLELGIACPHCKKGIVVRRQKKKISDPIPGEYEEKLEVMEATQKTIKESTEPKIEDPKRAKRK